MYNHKNKCIEMIIYLFINYIKNMIWKYDTISSLAFNEILAIPFYLLI